MCGGAIISDLIPSPVARRAAAQGKSVWADIKSKKNQWKSSIDDFEDDFDEFDDLSDIDGDSEFDEFELFDVKPFAFSSGIGSKRKKMEQNGKRHKNKARRIKLQETNFLKT